MEKYECDTNAQIAVKLPRLYAFGVLFLTLLYWFYNREQFKIFKLLHERTILSEGELGDYLKTI